MLTSVAVSLSSGFCDSIRSGQLWPHLLPPGISTRQDKPLVIRPPHPLLTHANYMAVSDLLLLIAITLTMLPKPKTMFNFTAPENGAL